MFKGYYVREGVSGRLFWIYGLLFCLRRVFPLIISVIWVGMIFLKGLCWIFQFPFSHMVSESGVVSDYSERDKKLRRLKKEEC